MIKNSFLEGNFKGCESRKGDTKVNKGLVQYSTNNKAVEDSFFNRLSLFLGWWVGKDNKNRQPLPFRVGAGWRGKCFLLMS